jgi:hypothetical protein
VSVAVNGQFLLKFENVFKETANISYTEGEEKGENSVKGRFG